MSREPLYEVSGSEGVDVLTVPEAGLLGADDETHLAKAMSEGRVLYTQDEDFLRSHAAGVEHAGIVYARQGRQSARSFVD
jgi:hypothetical protein